MSLFVMLNPHRLTLFIWIVSVLTLSISDEVKTDGTTPLTSTSSTNFINASSISDRRILFSTIQPASKIINSTERLNKNVVTPSFAGEGGPISIASTTQRVSSTTFRLADISDNAPNVIKRNNTLPKIVSKKGANEMLDVKEENSSFIEKALSNDKKSDIEHSTIASIIPNNKERINADLNNFKLNITDKHSKNDSNTVVNNMLQQNVSTSTTIITSSLKEHKAKPTVTIAGPNSDKRPFVSPTRSRLGMPKKIDYVLPVIITLIALPILGAIMFMVYKQGRDCWDKRHYRRMDFLIDGMYND